MAESARPLHQLTKTLVAASGRARINKRLFLKTFSLSGDEMKLSRTVAGQQGETFTAKRVK